MFECEFLCVVFFLQCGDKYLLMCCVLASEEKMASKYDRGQKFTYISMRNLPKYPKILLNLEGYGFTTGFLLLNEIVTLILIAFNVRR